MQVDTAPDALQLNQSIGGEGGTRLEQESEVEMQPLQLYPVCVCCWCGHTGSPRHQTALASGSIWMTSQALSSGTR